MKDDTKRPTRASFASLEEAFATLAPHALTHLSPAPRPAPAPVPAAPASTSRTSSTAARCARPSSRPSKRNTAATERRERHIQTVRALGAAGYAPRDWPPSVWNGARRMYRDGNACAQMVAELPRVLALRVRRAALAVRRLDDGTWVRGRTWAHVTARVTAAIAWAMYRTARSSRRRGASLVATGISRPMIAALFERFNGGGAYSVSWLAATHAGRNGDQRGPLRLLEDAGAWWRHQPPASATPEHAGPPRRGKDGVLRRYAFNQYHFDAQTTDPAARDVDGAADNAVAALSADALSRRYVRAPRDVPAPA